jgi:enoyl-CoA hydratase/carnithine racemase
MTSQDTLYAIENGIATITLNRPEQMNTLGGTMMALVSQYIQQAEDDKTVRVIILTGAGRMFCAGLDWWARNLERVHKRAPTMLPASR